ncbi:MAG: DUF362 domain-containing protein, partial [Candidatus Bathyarchaeia archaeon]
MRSEILRRPTNEGKIDRSIELGSKLKLHNEAGVTLGMKNMFGLLPDKLKCKYHMRDINKVIVDVNTVLKPSLV